MAALARTAAMGSGASRAFLASVISAVEATQVHGLLPLLGACAIACLVSSLLMRQTIMIEHSCGVARAYRWTTAPTSWIRWPWATRAAAQW
ncbi:hypothetical protein [Xanthomonas maliensis]|uniref:hypothetical protein n=1 Tax=Xanthomonas maliensis TaxID=1321368 RepID=UPI00039C29F4|nr:hypothetical protein [Xanthomonas maliensis]KAB7766329.1 hypothetical protein CKY51_13935 [Xanthomonas maliensis]